MTELDQLFCAICHLPIGWLDRSWKEEIENHCYCPNCVSVSLKK